MILVTDAGYQGIVALSACSTLPVSASTTSKASACAPRGAASARAATSRIRFNDGWRSSGRIKCTIAFRSFETRLRKRRSWDLAFGFQACPVPSLTAAANLYRLGDTEQRPAHLIVDEIGAISAIIQACRRGIRATLPPRRPVHFPAP